MSDAQSQGSASQIAAQRNSPVRLTTHEQRAVLVAPFLSGRGLEFGAGISPQKLPPGVECIYFDKRSRQELAALFNVDASAVPPVHGFNDLPSLFPDGADFLIAHHVLEHLSNPIGALVAWLNHLKDGGVLVLSLPDAKSCLDRERLVPSFEHLLLDHLLDRGDDCFESREHIFSFILGWREAGVRKEMNAAELAANCFLCAKKDRNDLHWHAYDYDIANNLVRAAVSFAQRSATFELVAHPNHVDENLRTSLDILFVIRVENSSRMQEKRTEDDVRFSSLLARHRAAFADMLKRFDGLK